MIEICGWLGSILLALRAIPQLYKTIKTRKANDISRTFLIMWTVGNLLSIVYVLPDRNIPLLFNFTLNTIIPFILLLIKLKRI